MANNVHNTDNLVKSVKEWFQTDFEIHEEWMKRAAESWGFYTGLNQWDSRTVRQLQKKGKLALTINMVMNTINMPCGYQRRNRFDYRLEPLRGGNQPVAMLGSAMIKHTLDSSGAEYENSDAFAEGLITGKGWTRAYVNQADDPLYGNLAVEKVPAAYMMEDQLCQDYDLDKCNHVFFAQWMDKNEAALKYEVSKNDLEQAATGDRWAKSVEDAKYSSAIDIVGSDYDYSYNTEDHMRTDVSRITKRKFLIRETWFKEMRKVQFLCDRSTDQFRRINGQKDLEIARQVITLSENNTLQIKEQIAPVMYKLTTCGDMVLDYERDPLGISCQRYPFFRFCPTIADGKIISLVDGIKDPQRELNKRRSQSLHITNQSGGNQWAAASLNDKKAAADLARRGSLPDQVFDLSKYGGSLERLSGPKLDTAHLTLAEGAANDIKVISGVNSDLLGTNSSASESGKARMVRQEAGLITLEGYFDNFERTQTKQGTFVWEQLRKNNLYSESELKQIVSENTLKDFIVQQPDGSVAIDLSPIRDMYVGSYGVKVSKGARSSTARMYNAEMLIDVIKETGLQVPPEYLVDVLDLPDKQGLIESIRQQQQAMSAQQPMAGVV